MIYAVIDTNVIVSALLSPHNDTSTALIRSHLLEGSIVPLYNEEIYQEYIDVLHRPKFHLPEGMIDDIGIPVRLDWTFASGRWLDVYLGGGLEGNYCLVATLAGDWVAKDGFSASLLGAGGIQFKITEKLGVYFEPELSWTFTPKNQILESYRTKNPLMFSVSSGLRITIGK